jgi:hypothetical protein
MFVMTAITGARRRKEPSLSSASATSSSPSPSRVVLGEASGASTRPPITAVGSRPEHPSTWAMREVVVVLPWLPATAMPSLSRISSASISARGMTGILRRSASSSSAFVARMADEKTTTSASPRWLAS